MEKVAVLMTCFNRKDKTLKCLRALSDSLSECNERVAVDVFLTDDGCTDGTVEAVKADNYVFSVCIVKGNGNLFWNGGMIVAWETALRQGRYDGYLWLNNDTFVYPHLWNELWDADEYSFRTYQKRGIYVGSTQDPQTGRFTYGGFNFISKWTLKDQFVYPDGEFHLCQCAHGNVTYISHEIVERMGILCRDYRHGGGDHDYTYLAYKAGFPLIVLRNYVGTCENDHKEGGYADFLSMRFNDRIRYLYSPVGFNLHNTLLFQKRCFPYRYPFVWIMGYAKAIFPKIYFSLYRKWR